MIFFEKNLFSEHIEKRIENTIFYAIAKIWKNSTLTQKMKYPPIFLDEIET